MDDRNCHEGLSCVEGRCRGATSDGDTDVDGDGDGDGGDADSDVDIDTGADSDLDGDGNAGADSDLDLDSDGDGETDTERPVMYVNPGCDPVVRTMGIDAAWTQGSAVSEQLLITQGTRRWCLDLGTRTWIPILTTDDLAYTWETTIGPRSELNPGLNEQVRSQGITAAWTVYASNRSRYLVVVADTNHFTLDLNMGQWVGDEGRTGILSEVFAAQGTFTGSSCYGGDPLTNPGNDSGIQEIGIQAISEFNTSGGFHVAGAGQLWYGACDADNFTFQFSCHFTSQSRGFIQTSPVCDGGPPINPGCDPAVGDHGIDTAYWTNTDGVFHVTQGTRHWGRRTQGSSQGWAAEEYIPNLATYWQAHTTPDCTETVAHVRPTP